MLLSIFGATLVCEGPYNNSKVSTSDQPIAQKCLYENNDQGGDEVDAVHPRFAGQRRSNIIMNSTMMANVIGEAKDQRTTFNQQIQQTDAEESQPNNRHSNNEILLSSNNELEPIGNFNNGLKEKDVVVEIKSNKSEMEEVVMCSQLKKRIKENPIVRMFTLIEWALLTKPYFLCTMFGSSFSFVALLNYFLLLPSLCVELGLTENQISVLLSATNATDVIFRLMFAWAGDWGCSKKIFCGKPRRMLYAISVLGFGLFMIGKLNNQFISLMRSV